MGLTLDSWDSPKGAKLPGAMEKSTGPGVFELDHELEAYATAGLPGRRLRVELRTQETRTAEPAWKGLDYQNVKDTRVGRMYEPAARDFTHTVLRHLRTLPASEM